MKVADIDRELELARTQGPVRDIIIPPCPDLLAQRRGHGCLFDSHCQ
jgi:hypothetical protein